MAVAPLLHHVRDLFVLRAEELQVSLEVEPPEVADVLGDVDRLEQVLTNLVDNALRHTPADGRVWLGARQESDATVSLTVSDTGTGIAPEALRQVFDRFSARTGRASRAAPAWGWPSPGSWCARNRARSR